MDEKPDEPVYWTGSLGPVDDFGLPYHGTMYDAKTTWGGRWANMSEVSWRDNRESPKLGLGHGQKYQQQEDGRWLKVEG